jgi:hypothetical protein
MESYAKFLSKKYGGKWRYDYKMTARWCDDGKREVRRVCDLDEDYDSRFPPTYVMYDADGNFLEYVSCPFKELGNLLSGVGSCKKYS